MNPTVHYLAHKRQINPMHILTSCCFNILPFTYRSFTLFLPSWFRPVVLKVGCTAFRRPRGPVDGNGLWRCTPSSALFAYLRLKWLPTGRWEMWYHFIVITYLSGLCKPLFCKAGTTGDGSPKSLGTTALGRLHHYVTCYFLTPSSYDYGGGPPLASCLQLLIQYFRSYPHISGGCPLCPQPEGATYRGTLNLTPGRNVVSYWTIEEIPCFNWTRSFSDWAT